VKGVKNVKSKTGKKLRGLKVQRILAFSMLFTVNNRPWRYLRLFSSGNAGRCYIGLVIPFGFYVLRLRFMLFTSTVM